MLIGDRGFGSGSTIRSRSEGGDLVWVPAKWIVFGGGG